MIDHEILQRDPGGARALLAQLSGEHPDLTRRVEALEAEIRAAAEREAELLRLEHDRDLSVGGGVQLALVGVCLALTLAALVYMRGRGDEPAGATVLLGVPSAFFTVLLAAYLISRRRLRTGISRKATGMLLVVVGAIIVHRAVLLGMSAPLPALFAGDLVLCATVSATASIALLPRARWLVPVHLAGAIAVMLRPDACVPIFSTAVVVATALLLVMWRHAVQKRPG
jgi:hypothetical protein